MALSSLRPGAAYDIAESIDNAADVDGSTLKDSDESDPIRNDSVVTESRGTDSTISDEGLREWEKAVACIIRMGIAHACKKDSRESGKVAFGILSPAEEATVEVERVDVDADAEFSVMMCSNIVNILEKSGWTVPQRETSRKPAALGRVVDVGKAIPAVLKPDRQTTATVAAFTQISQQRTPHSGYFKPFGAYPHCQWLLIALFGSREKLHNARMFQTWGQEGYTNEVGLATYINCYYRLSLSEYVARFDRAGMDIIFPPQEKSFPFSKTKMLFHMEKKDYKTFLKHLVDAGRELRETESSRIGETRKSRLCRVWRRARYNMVVATVRRFGIPTMDFRVGRQIGKLPLGLTALEDMVFGCVASDEEYELDDLKSILLEDQQE